MQERMLDTIVIGTRKSGLAADYYLQKSGLQFYRVYRTTAPGPPIMIC